MKPSSIGLLGIGTAVPETVRTNADFEPVLRRIDEEQKKKDFLALDRSAAGGAVEMPREIAEAMSELGADPFRGARVRHVLRDEEDVSDLEAKAAQRALRDAGVGPEEIDLVIVHSLLPDRLIPSNGPALQDKCGLTRAVAWSLDAGCASFQAHLVAACGVIGAGLYRRVLIIQSSAFTRTVEPDSPQAIGLGDAASAAVVGEVAEGFGLVSHWSRTDGSLRDGIVLAPTCGGRPVRAWWRPPKDAGPPRTTSFAPDLGKAGGLRAAEYAREACLAALAAAGLAPADVDLFLTNQTMAWFPGACRRAVGIGASRTFDTYREVANIGSATIVHNLVAARRQGMLTHGATLLLYSPGAGFTRSAVVLRWSATTRP